MATFDSTKYMAQEFFTYSAPLDSLAAGASSSVQINIQANSDFMINKIVFAVFDAATGDIVADPNMTVNLVDAGSGLSLFDNPQPIGNVAGTAQLPFVPPVAKLLKAKSTLSVQYANRSAVTLYNIIITFHGSKLYLAN